jgi:hypothetical protein
LPANGEQTHSFLIKEKNSLSLKAITISILQNDIEIRASNTTSPDKYNLAKPNKIIFSTLISYL